MKPIKMDIPPVDYLGPQLATETLSYKMSWGYCAALPVCHCRYYEVDWESWWYGDGRSALTGRCQRLMGGYLRRTHVPRGTCISHNGPPEMLYSEDILKTGYYVPLYSQSYLTKGHGEQWLSKCVMWIIVWTHSTEVRASNLEVKCHEGTDTQIILIQTQNYKRNEHHSSHLSLSHWHIYPFMSHTQLQKGLDQK